LIHEIYQRLTALLSFLATHPSGHRTLLPVGPAYLNHLRVSLHHAYSFSSLDKHLAAERERLAALHGDDGAGEDDLGVGDEEETQELLKLDPKEWKVLFFPS
jgi:DnaJ family protein C protein 2